MRLLALFTAFLFLVLLGTFATAQPNPDEYRRWCHEQESKINAHFSLPSNLKSKKLERFRAIVAFHLLPSGQVGDFHAIRTSKADKAIISIPEKDFVAVENAMIEAVKKSAPLSLPKTETKATGTYSVKYIYEPNGPSPTEILLIAE
jgi:hypothetical protein